MLLLISKARVTPGQIVRKTGMYESHVSRTLKELLEKKLVICENPKERRFKFYRITKLGKDVVKEVEKLLKEIGK